jgi:membrane protein DedA with SNARE-associated domain
MSSVFGIDWSNPSAIGYPVVFGGVLVGSIVPILPTGAVVGAGAALAMTGQLNLPLVVVFATLGALIGDLVTFAAGRGGRGPMTRFFERRQSADKLTSARERFSQMVPAGRIPVLLAAGALDYPWRRLVPAATGACLLWAVAYALLGVVSGGLFDNPLVATLIATTLILVITMVVGLVARRRERKRAHATTS